MRAFYSLNEMKSKILLLIGTLIVCSVSAIAQKRDAKPVTKIKQIIFAVIDDGSRLEPIAAVENGKLFESSADDDTWASKPFSDFYFKPASNYGLIFGGVPSGTVTIKSSNAGKDCGGITAEISVESTKTKLKDFVMALGTNINTKTRKSGVRRSPTAIEKSAIEALVRTEYKKHKVPATSYKQLHYSNLTALDVNGDGVAELVGSYWVKPKTGVRSHLFFIAEKGSSGKYSFTYREYEAYTADKVMSGDLEDLDGDYGMYQTLLLDVFDYDNDGTAEIFTIGKAFEGNNYHVFKRVRGKWTRVFDTYVYRCGY